jgi:chemotaxis protein MotB
MAGKDSDQSIIVVKRVKKGHHAHHGGAWKIAYADFVTAMMAFFLLMWLLGSTTQGDLKGISDYFNAPMKVAMLGGRGAGDASSLINGGGTDITRRDGDVSAQERLQRLRAARMEAAKLEAQRLTALKSKVESALAANPKVKDYLNQVKLEVTPDGLRIQIVDDQQRPMFDVGSAKVNSYMRDLLRNIGAVLNEMDSRVTLAGHTDSRAWSNGERGYSNWELSADRANASRRELVAGGMAESKIFRVQGLADSLPLDANDALAPVNRRISITVMNKQAEARLLNGGHDAEASDAEDLRDLVNSDPKPAAPGNASVALSDVPQSGAPDAAPGVAPAGPATGESDAATKKTGVLRALPGSTISTPRH